jgi:bifunctional glutamyl/prolyl-tRNA synthetase
LELKAQYKTLTGKDWKPEAAVAQTPVPTKSPTVSTASGDANSISSQIKEKGDVIRDLKTNKAAKVK